jgi:hypothetical protein
MLNTGIIVSISPVNNYQSAQPQNEQLETPGAVNNTVKASHQEPATHTAVADNNTNTNQMKTVGSKSGDVFNALSTAEHAYIDELNTKTQRAMTQQDRALVIQEYNAAITSFGQKYNLPVSNEALASINNEQRNKNLLPFSGYYELFTPEENHEIAGLARDMVLGRNAADPYALELAAKKRNDLAQQYATAHGAPLAAETLEQQLTINRNSPLQISDRPFSGCLDKFTREENYNIGELNHKIKNARSKKDKKEFVAQRNDLVKEYGDKHGIVFSAEDFVRAYNWSMGR